MRRVRCGVYRLVHFPPGEHEDLAAVWLCSDRAGVLSHETALSLHEISDVLPARVHLTVPSDWSRRRLRVPRGVVLAYADVPKVDIRSLDASSVRAALERVFAFRRVQPLPARLPAPPAEWAVPYARGWEPASWSWKRAPWG